MVVGSGNCNHGIVPTCTNQFGTNHNGFLVVIHIHPFGTKHAYLFQTEEVSRLC